MADSRHNKYVSVTDWFKPAPGSTASGTVSGSTGAATSGASFIGGSWGSGGSGGGLTITIIKTNDTTPESNSNVYSALRVHNSFIAKDKDERTEGKLSSDAGFEVGEFVSGVSGAICYVDPETLQTTAELDRLKVRVKAYFETLEIVNVNSVGGKQIISPAGSINCIRVDEHGGTIDILKERQATDEEGNPLYDINGNPIMETYIESVDNGVPEDTYRCYFLAELDGETIENRFHVGDQAYSQMFDAQPGISSNVSSKYYWRLVTGISYDPIEIAGKKYHYIDLSVSDCDTDSDAPSVGDIICHRGHRTLPGDIEGRDRQNALEFSAVDTFSPSITLYQGIGESDPDNGKYPYSLVGKDIIQYGVNRLNNRAFMNVYGDMYVGDRDGQSYLQFDETAGLTVKGNIQFGSKSKMEGDDLTLEERIELASKAYEEDVNQFKAAVEKSFLDVLDQIDGAIETYFLDPEPTLENEPAVDWNTDLIKASHVGDLYYSKQGNAYRFQYEEITNDDGSKYNLYYWNLIKDTDITLALANAQKAQDTADSKRKIFVKQPSTNDSYEEGDMWANATYPATGTPRYSNDLLRAITAKQPGEAFSIDHWVLSSKYTDDTAAIAAQEAADEAQRVANNAQSDATAAANRLSSWAADNVISPTEKQGIKEEYVRVIKDKDSIHEQWDYYFLDTTASTEIGQIYIAYNNAYLPYVEQLIYLFTAKDSDGVTLENIPIPDDFDDNQTAYYSNRTIALNTIAAAAKKVADDAQAAADNAYEEAEKALTAAEEAKTSVYGLNTTVTGLKDFTDDAFLDGIINSSERKTIENYIYQINTVLAQVQQSYSEVVDNTFLVESVAKTNLENSYNSFITATNELLQTVNVISNQGSVENIDRAGFEVKYNNFNSKYSDYTKYLNAAIKFIEYAINSRVDTTLQELGGYSYLKNAFNEETTVTGGLVLTSLVALGYTDDNQQYHVMGGINGSHANNDGIAIWAGGSAVDRAIEPNNPNAADFLVRMDGTGYAAGGNFWWESDGTIHADPLSFVISENSVGALLSSLKVYYDVTDSKPSPYALEPLVPFTKLTIASDIELNSNARVSFGDVYLAYDNVNNAVYIANQNGSPVNFYISGGISMYSAGSMTSTSIMDIIAQNIDTNTLQINDQGLLTVIGGGTGGGGSIDFPLSWSGFSSGSFDGSAAKTIYIPSKLSELTNDASYAKTTDLSGYLPLTGGTLTNLLTLQYSNPRIAFKTSSDKAFGSLGVFSGKLALYTNSDNKYNDIIHSGNYQNYALPLSGGTIDGNVVINSTTTGPLNVNTTSTVEVGIPLKMSSVTKGWIGYSSTGGTYLYNNASKHYLGIKDDGSIYYNKGTILHSGNYSSYALPLSGGQMNANSYIAWNNGHEGNDIDDWDAVNGSGLRIISSAKSGTKAPATYSTALHVKGRYGFQISSVGGDNDRFYIRNIRSLRPWMQIIHSGNIGSQSVSYASSAGNADTLDGKHDGELTANQLKKNHSTEKSVRVIYNSGFIPKGNTTDNTWCSPTGTYTEGNSQGEWMGIIRVDMSSSYYHDLSFNMNGACPKWRQVINGSSAGWREFAFTDSNVASATNADKVDGYHAASIFTYEGETYTNGESSLWDSLGTKVYANALPDGLTGVYNYGQTISFGAGNAKFDMYVSHISTSPNYDNSNGGIYVRSGWQSDRVHWRRLAFMDSNVASATKLQTARTIWGQSFDGSGNVSGRLDMDSLVYFMQGGTAHGYLGFASSDTDLYLNANRTLFISGKNNLILNGYSDQGNVGIGTTNPAYKLDVSTNSSDNIVARFTNTSYHSGILINSKTGYNPYIQLQMNNSGVAEIGRSYAKNTLYFGASGTDVGYLNVLLSNGNIGIGTTAPAYKLDVSGAIHSTDSVFADYSIFANSGKSGCYLHGTGISWHDSTNSWVMDLVTYGASNDIITLHRHASLSGGLSTTYASATRFLTNKDTDTGIWTGSVFTGGLSNKDIAYNANIHWFLGSVGVGTNSPSYTLQVAGDLGVNTSINLYSGDQINGHSGIALNYNLGKHVNVTIWDGWAGRIAHFVTGGITFDKSLSINSDLSATGALSISGISNFHSILTNNGSNSIGSYPSIRWHIPNVTWVQFCLTGSGIMELRDGGSQSGTFAPLSVGSFTSNGNILCTGSITMNSMRSMKNIINENGLSLEELSTIKPTRFTWKDGRDDRIHVGGIADDVMKVLPEVVFKGSDGVLSMDYASAAFVMAASLIQPMTEHERRIANLERENALLKEEIRNLKSA